MWMELMRMVERLAAELTDVCNGQPAEYIIKDKNPTLQSFFAADNLALTRCGEPEQARKVRRYTAATGM